MPLIPYGADFKPLLFVTTPVPKSGRSSHSQLYDQSSESKTQQDERPVISAKISAILIGLV